MAVISLCDYTGNMIKPWTDAGHQALLIDPQHGVTTSIDGIVKYAGTILEALPTIRLWIKTKDISLVAGFPPCTDLAVSGSRWFNDKSSQDKHFQSKAALIAEQCRMIGMISGAPWFLENPVSVLSSIIGKPNYSFHPWQYNGLEPNDNYTKKTMIWSGGGFTLPKFEIDETLGPPDNRIHYASPGPERANIRSATPMGFAKAVYRHLN